MHSTVKNPKYKNSCGKKNSEDEKNDGCFEEPHFSKTNKKLNHLCVEIEMNESVRNLLSSPDKCASALLDVTVIKPVQVGEQSKYQTSTLKGTQVRKMLANLDREKRDKRLLNEIFEDKAPSEDTIVRICKHNPRKKMQAASDFCYDTLKERKYVKTQFHRPPRPRKNFCSSAPVDVSGRKQMNNQYYSPEIMQVSPAIGESCPKSSHYDGGTDESFSDEVLSPVNAFKCGDHKKTQHIYAAPRTFKDLNSIITCQSMSKDDRIPCLCEHCGIASLLSETQKRPIITAPVEHVSDLRRKMNRKEYKDTKHEYRKRKQDVPYNNMSEEKSSFQAGMTHLFERVKTLEERMDIQEERAVPKDYFKRIITKIISHFSPKPPYKNENFQIKDSDSNSYFVEPRYKNSYSVNTLLVDKTPSQKIQVNKPNNHHNLKKLLSNLTENMPESKKTEFVENFWKWGGETLQPGVDLKKKILSLLDLTQEMKKKDERGHSRPKTEEKSKDAKRPESSKSKRSLPGDKDFNSEAFKSFVEAMSAKIYKTHNKNVKPEKHVSQHQINVNKSSPQTQSDSSLYKKPNCDNNDQKSMRKSMIPKMTKKEEKSANKNDLATKKLDVSYVNPKMSTWQEEESQISFRLEFSDADTNSRSKDSKNRELEKLEFLRTLSRTKDSDKEKLWESIWAQAKANGQTKQDKVTIQLPRRNGSEFNDMIEIEFTIGEIEYMLTKHKYVDKNKGKS